jgi:hypothetical protein
MRKRFFLAGWLEYLRLPTDPFFYVFMGIIGFLVGLVVLAIVDLNVWEPKREIKAEQYKQLAEWCVLYPEFGEREIKHYLKDGKITREEYGEISISFVCHYKVATTHSGEKPCDPPNSLD